MSDAWGPRALSSLARYVNGFAFKPEHWGDEGLPIVRIEQLNNPDGNYDYCSVTVPSDNLIDDGDLIFSWSATLKVAFWRRGKAALNQHLFKVIPEPDVDQAFLFQLLDYHMEALAGGAHGSTMKHIKRSELDRFVVEIPKKNVQTLLASVLGALDAQIEATEALIAKEERLRAGLMQDLFTRGVDENGELRPPREEAPHLYQETELGWLPREWDTKAAGELLQSIEQGWSPDCASEPAYLDEWGVLKTSSIVWSGFDRSENKRLPASLIPRTALRVALGDVLMTRAGPNSRVGVVAQVRAEPGNLMISDKIYRLVPKPSIDRSFLAMALSSGVTQTYLSRFKTGLAESQTNISQAVVRRLSIGLPPDNEQKLMVAALDAVESEVGKRIQSLHKLTLQKIGLMQDLLTSTVSVEPLLEKGPA